LAIYRNNYILGRSTADADAVASHPKLSTFARAVADELDLAPTWVNDGVTAYRDLLPSDFASRTVFLGTFGHLRVRVLGREDLIIMKIAASRPRDLDDLRALAPTADELAFVARQLPESIRSPRATPCACNCIWNSAAQRRNVRDQFSFRRPR
jgi:hypothetical protein